MPKNEDGEFELLVGNKQLLSIVVALVAVMGVVFSMGYLLGRSGSAGEVAATTGTPPAVSGQGRPDAAGRPSPPAANSSVSSEQVQVPDAGTGTSPVTSGPPAGSGTAPVEPAAEAPAPPPQQETRPAVVRAKPPEPPPPAPPQQSAGSPAPGETYLQVGAGKKLPAEALVEVLKKKGFKAIISPVTVNGEVYRALVGPVTGAQDLARTKAELQRAGIPCIVKRF